MKSGAVTRVKPRIFLIALAVVAADQATKAWMGRLLADARVIPA